MNKARLRGPCSASRETVGWMMGLEPTTTGITILDSTNRATSTIVVASTAGNENLGLPDRNRTCNPQLRRLVLYPVELRAETHFSGTISYCLGVVGVRGFEPPTSCSQSRRATGLRYTPKSYRRPAFRAHFGEARLYLGESAGSILA